MTNTLESTVPQEIPTKDEYREALENTSGEKEFRRIISNIEDFVNGPEGDVEPWDFGIGFIGDKERMTTQEWEDANRAYEEAASKSSALYKNWRLANEVVANGSRDPEHIGAARILVRDVFLEKLKDTRELNKELTEMTHGKNILDKALTVLSPRDRKAVSSLFGGDDPTSYIREEFEGAKRETIDAAAALRYIRDLSQGKETR